MKIQKQTVYIQKENLAYISSLKFDEIRNIMATYHEGLSTLTETIGRFANEGMHVQSMKPGLLHNGYVGEEWTFVNIQEVRTNEPGVAFFEEPHLRITFTVQFLKSNDLDLSHLEMTQLNMTFIMFGMVVELDLINPNDENQHLGYDIRAWIEAAGCSCSKMNKE